MTPDVEDQLRAALATRSPRPCSTWTASSSSTNATLDGARQALDRLHRQVAESVPIPEQPQLRYSFSSGLTLACVEDNADHLYHRADTALYQAKREGRGRSVVIESGTPPD